MIPIGESRLERLEELRRAASLEQFGASDRGPFATREEATVFIRASLRLYVQTWLLPPIDQFIDNERDRRERLKKAKRLKEAKGHGRLWQ